MSGASNPQAATNAAPAPAQGLWMQVFRDSLIGTAAHALTEQDAEQVVQGAIYLADATQAAMRKRRAAKTGGGQ